MSTALALFLIWLALSVGFILGAGWVQSRRRSKFIGIINVTLMEDKMIYSLELDRPAEDLEHMEDVWFRVKSPVVGDSQGNHGL